MGFDKVKNVYSAGAFFPVFIGPVPFIGIFYGSGDVYVIEGFYVFPGGIVNPKAELSGTA
jgi:hypothetical protein